MRKPELAGSWEGGLELSQKSFPQVLPCGVQSAVLRTKTKLCVVGFKIVPRVLAFYQSCAGFGCKGYLKKIINHLLFTVKFVKLD